MENNELEWKCVMCGNCCRNYDWYKREAWPILKEMLPNENLELPPTKNGICIYFHNNKCDIYKNRPLVCNARKMFELCKPLYNWQDSDFSRLQKESCRINNMIAEK